MCRTHNEKARNAGKVCELEFCDKPLKSAIYCRTHYKHSLEGRELSPLQERKTYEKKRPNYVYICMRYACGLKATHGDFCKTHTDDERLTDAPVCTEKGCKRKATFIPNTGKCPKHGEA